MLITSDIFPVDFGHFDNQLLDFRGFVIFENSLNGLERNLVVVCGVSLTDDLLNLSN